MSAEKLIGVMERLIKLHQSLLELSNKKKDIVVNGDMDALNQLLKDEQAHLAAINQIDNERQKFAKILHPNLEDPTISDCVEAASGVEKKTLERLRLELLDLISQLKEKNELNQQLIFQSLHFVNFSLSLLLPKPEEINYGPEAGKTNTQGYSSGLFNSKA